jgi:mannosyltransferase OCH1-like enzyme
MKFKKNQFVKINEITKQRHEMIKKYNEIRKQYSEYIKKCNDIREEKNEENKIINKYYFLNKLYSLKLNYNSIIPLHLYTCWHTKDLPPLMRENFNYLIESNPLISFHLFDELECREFIQSNFESDVLFAYDHLIPCSYKSDLWRYCILYINGGIYMDIKYRCKNNFKFISLTEKEYFVRDKNPLHTYTALIVTLPKNNIIYNCIRKIIENVNNQFYGEGCLDITGPGLLGSFFNQEEKNSMELYHDFSFVENKINKFYIVKENTIILEFYENYREEQSKYQKNKHYGELWREKNIYIY